jgi:hypothetical protein
LSGADQVTDQVKALLKVMNPRRETSTEDLMKALDRSHRPTFRQNYLHPALGADYVEMTIPSKPNSPLQRYRLVGKNGV